MIDRKGFYDYLKYKAKTKTGKTRGKSLEKKTQDQYFYGLSIFKIDGWFDSIYELDVFDDDTLNTIKANPAWDIYNIGTNRIVGAAVSCYYEYLHDDSCVKRFVEKNENNVPEVNHHHFDFQRTKNAVEEIVYPKDSYFDSSQIESIHQYMMSKGFYYSLEQLVNFYLALKTKPFVLLAGISGTGKTRLARLFAEAVGAADDDRYLQVAVKPDWADSSDIFGFTNLKGEFVLGDITKFIAKAMTDINKPYFLVLDEMNLARVEYYFSDFLSLMETSELKDDGTFRSDAMLKDEIQPWIKNSEMNEDIFKDGIYIPQNLYVIGTVNMDESTFPFSKKVLDRAITIEFNDVDLHSRNLFVGDEVYPMTDIDNSYFISSYHSMLDVEADNNLEYANEIIDVISVWNDILKKAHLNIGFRVRNNILFYNLYAQKISFVLNQFNPMDNCMMQKILPRIQGSSQAIKDVLTGLNDVLDDDYPMSKEKIRYMLERYNSDGFTAFWL